MTIGARSRKQKVEKISRSLIDWSLSLVSVAASEFVATNAGLCTEDLSLAEV